MIMFPDNFSNDTLTHATCNVEVSRGRLSPLPCDRHHHYYHYQSSAQYLWLARTHGALGRQEEARAAYNKALFQDHFNEAAKEEKESGARGKERSAYNKHPLFDREFCASVGALPTRATQCHDEAVAAFLAGYNDRSLGLLDNAIGHDPAHSNSYFARGKCYFMKEEYEKARMDFDAAIRLSHLKHDAYHRFASSEHLARGKDFMTAGELDLAIAGFSKALDLYRGNKDALAARAEAYRMKGNSALAERDEQEARGQSG